MMINRILAILLMFWPYSFILCGFAESEEIVSALMITYVLLTLVVYVASIINAFLYKGKNRIYELALFDMLIKLIHIPFYIMVFVIGILSFFIAVVPALVLVAPIMIFILFVIDALLMLTSSTYGISALLKASKAGMVSRTFMIVNIILHCFFVTDIISSVIIFIRLRHRSKASVKALPVQKSDNN